jgi:hypothetical protein
MPSAKPPCKSHRSRARSSLYPSRRISRAHRILPMQLQIVDRFTDERHRHRRGAPALARYAAGGLGGVEQGRVEYDPPWLPADGRGLAVPLLDVRVQLTRLGRGDVVTERVEMAGGSGLSQYGACTSSVRSA